MTQNLLKTGHPMRMMWGCLAVILLVGVVGFTTSTSVLVFAVPCALMMGAMVWMMLRGKTPGG